MTETQQCEIGLLRASFEACMDEAEQNQAEVEELNKRLRWLTRQMGVKLDRLMTILNIDNRTLSRDMHHNPLQPETIATMRTGVHGFHYSMTARAVTWVFEHLDQYTKQ